MNTYLVTGHYYMARDNEKQVIFRLVVARSVEEALSVIRSIYYNAVIDRIELRDRNVIIGNSVNE